MATKHALDFTNVKEGGNFSKKHMPAGDYLARITKVEDTMPKDTSDKTPMWLFTVQLVQTPSATYPYYCKLQENQLWKVRNLLVAAGINVPKKRVAVDPNRLIGKQVAVSLDDTEYNGKEQSEVGAVFSPNELAGSVDEPDEDEPEDDEEEEPAPPPKKRAAKKPEPEPESEEEEEEEEEPPPPPKRRKPAPEPELEEEEEEEEEEEPPPPPKKTARRKPPPPPEDEDDDELDLEDLD